jgi:hypothetical protein
VVRELTTTQTETGNVYVVAPVLSDAVRRLHAGDNRTCDFELYSPSRFGGLGMPVYEPKYWDKVQELDMWTNRK